MRAMKRDGRMTSERWRKE